MTKRDWAELRIIGMFLNGEEIAAPGPHGEKVRDDSFLVLFNAHHEDVVFKLPTRRFGDRWELELSTADPNAASGSLVILARSEVSLQSRSVLLLKRGS